MPQLNFSQVVIASSWKYRFSLHEIRSFFSEFIGSWIVGVMPESTTSERIYGLSEIMEFLQENNATGNRWIAIDDFRDLYPEGCNVIVTDSHVGSLSSPRRN